MKACPYHAPGQAPARPEEFERRPDGAALHRLTCYQVYTPGPRIVPGRAARAWMDATPERFAYRCLPLGIANAMGWEILSPCRIEAEWNGGIELDDLTVAIDDPVWGARHFAQSHFGSGILTFHVGYLFRTDPGVGIWARGIPNLPKDGIAPLEGIIETDWLPFTFTMNWKMTRPGRISFAADEPICFITPIAYHALDAMVPEITPLAADPALRADFSVWSDARAKFNAGLQADEPATVKQGWQKWYMRGETAAQEPGNPAHVSKLVLAEPVVRAVDEKDGAG